MCEIFNRGALRMAVAQICQSMGWDSLQKSTQDLLTDVLQKYLEELAKTTHDYCHHFSRTEPNLEDLGLAFDEIGIPVHELEDFVSQVDQVPFSHQLPQYPMPKGCVLHHPRNGEIVDRLEYYSEHLPPLIKVTEHVEDEAEILETKERSVNGDAVDGETIVNEIKTVGEETSNEPVSVKRPADSPPVHDGDFKRRRLDFSAKGHKTESELDILQALQGNTSSPSPTPSPDLDMPSFRFPEKPALESEIVPVDVTQKSSEIKTMKQVKKKPLPKVEIKSPPSKVKPPDEKDSNSDSSLKVKSPAKKPALTKSKSPKANKNKSKNPPASKTLQVEPKLKSPETTNSNLATKSPIKSPQKSPQIKSSIKSPLVTQTALSVKSPPFLSPGKSPTKPSTPNKSKISQGTPSPKSNAKEKQKAKSNKDVNVATQNKKRPSKVKKGSQKSKNTEQASTSKASTSVASESSSNELSEGGLLTPFVPKLKIKPIVQENDRMTSYSVSELVQEGRSEPSLQAAKDQRKKTKKQKLMSSDESTTNSESPQKKIKIKKVKNESSSQSGVKSPPNKPFIKPITVTMAAAPEPMLLSVSTHAPPGDKSETSVPEQDESSELLIHGFKKKKKKHKEKEKDKTKKKDKHKDKMHCHLKVKKEKITGPPDKPLPIPRLKLKLEPQASSAVVTPLEKKATPEPLIKSKGGSTTSDHPMSSLAPPAATVIPPQRQPAAENISEDMVQRTVITETISSTIEYGEQMYYCPACGLPDDGSPMIGCEGGGCDLWYHWTCVGIQEEPPADSVWVCPNCTKSKEKKKKKKKKSKP